MMKNTIFITLLGLLSISLNAQQNFDTNANKDKRAAQTISKEDANRAKKEVRNQISDKENKAISVDKTEKKPTQKSKERIESLNKKVRAKKVEAKNVQENAVNEFSVSDVKAKRKTLELDKKTEKKNNNTKIEENEKIKVSGKDFGQERAKQAKLKKEEKTKALNNTLSEAEIKYNAGKDKVKAVKEKLEADKAAGTITDVEYTEKAEKIKKAENALEQLKSNISKSKKIQ